MVEQETIIGMPCEAKVFVTCITVPYCFVSFFLCVITEIASMFLFSFHWEVISAEFL